MTAALAPDLSLALPFYDELSRFFERALKDVRPKGTRGLGLFRHQIAALLAKGLTRRQVYQIAIQPHFDVAESSFYRWARKFVTQEAVDEFRSAWEGLLPRVGASDDKNPVATPIAPAQPATKVPATALPFVPEIPALAERSALATGSAGTAVAQPAPSADTAADEDDEKPWLKKRAQIQARIDEMERNSPENIARKGFALAAQILAEQERAKQAKLGACAPEFGSNPAPKPVQTRAAPASVVEGPPVQPQEAAAEQDDDEKPWLRRRAESLAFIEQMERDSTENQNREGLELAASILAEQRAKDAELAKMKNSDHWAGTSQQKQ